VFPKRTAHRPIQRDDQLIHQVLRQRGILRGHHPDAVSELESTAFALVVLVDREVDVAVIEWVHASS
jgi:hypothetical protein